jgi:hypothetical protein
MPNRGNVLVHSRNEQTMAHFLPSRYKVLWALRVSRYKVYSGQVTSQGTWSFIGSNGAVAVQGCWSPYNEQDLIAKNVTNQMTFIVRVSCRIYLRILFFFLFRSFSPRILNFPSFKVIVNVFQQSTFLVPCLAGVHEIFFKV